MIVRHFFFSAFSSFADKHLEVRIGVELGLGLDLLLDLLDQLFVAQIVHVKLGYVFKAFLDNLVGFLSEYDQRPMVERFGQ